MVVGRLVVHGEVAEPIGLVTGVDIGCKNGHGNHHSAHDAPTVNALHFEVFHDNFELVT